MRICDVCRSGREVAPCKVDLCLTSSQTRERPPDPSTYDPLYFERTDFDLCLACRVKVWGALKLHLEAQPGVAAVITTDNSMAADRRTPPADRKKGG